MVPTTRALGPIAFRTGRRFRPRRSTRRSRRSGSSPARPGALRGQTMTRDGHSGPDPVVRISSPLQGETVIDHGHTRWWCFAGEGQVVRIRPRVASEALTTSVVMLWCVARTILARP